MNGCMASGKLRIELDRMHRYRYSSHSMSVNAETGLGRDVGKDTEGGALPKKPAAARGVP
jgi:hypothetical protein